MLKPQTITRRAVLQGAGVMLSLPFLESQCTRGQAASDNNPRRLVCIGNHLGYYPGNFFPKDAGLNYQISPTLQPVERHRDDFTVNLRIDHSSVASNGTVQISVIVPANATADQNI